MIHHETVIEALDFANYYIGTCLELRLTLKAPL